MKESRGMMKKKPLSDKRKLEIVIEMIEANEVTIAMTAVRDWALPIVGYKDGYPVYANAIFAPFANKFPTAYWGEYEPLLSDLKAAFAKVGDMAAKYPKITAKRYAIQRIDPLSRYFTVYLIGQSDSIDYATRRCKQLAENLKDADCVIIYRVISQQLRTDDIVFLSLVNFESVEHFDLRYHEE